MPPMGIDDLLSLFGWLWHCVFEWFFGNTGRLIIKGLTLGKVDLDLDRWAQCFLASLVGVAFWGSILAGVLYWKLGHILQNITTA